MRFFTGNSLKRAVKFFMVPMLGLIALTNSGVASGQPVPKREVPVKVAPQLSQIGQLSADMAQYARQHSDPLLLVSAARLRGGIGPIGFNSGIGSSERWLDEALAMAPNDQVIATLVNQTRALLVRGRTPGPLVWQKRVLPTTPEQMSIQFRPGYRATIYAESNTNQGLTLRIQEPNGNSVCVDEASKSQTICSWIAAGTGRYVALVSVTAPGDILLISN